MWRRVVVKVGDEAVDIRSQLQKWLSHFDRGPTCHKIQVYKSMELWWYTSRKMKKNGRVGQRVKYRSAQAWQIDASYFINIRISVSCCTTARDLADWSSAGLDFRHAPFVTRSRCSMIWIKDLKFHILLSLRIHYLITYHILLSYFGISLHRLVCLSFHDLAEQVEAKSAGRGISTDSLAKSFIQVALVGSSLVSADRNRVDDSESKSLYVLLSAIMSFI